MGENERGREREGEKEGGGETEKVFSSHIGLT